MTLANLWLNFEVTWSVTQFLSDSWVCCNTHTSYVA